MKILIPLLALIVVAGCFHLDKLPAEFVSQPPKEIQEQSIQENKKSIRILQKVKLTKNPSINPEKMRQLIELKLYGNLLSTQTLVCHDNTIGVYQTFAKSNFSNSTELEDDYEDCNDKRIFVEEYIIRQAW